MAKQVKRNLMPGLSKRRIDGLKQADLRYVIWDDVVVGLGLRVYPTGRKAFVVMYRDAGNAKRLATVGDYGVFTLDQAREQARAMLREAESGNDAMKVRRANKAAPTFGDLIRDYKAKHVPRKRSGLEDVRRIDRHLLKWQARKLDTITRKDVQALVDRIGATAPYEGNRIHALLSKMFGLAMIWELLPATHPNPAKGVTRAPETKRERWVEPAELPRLASAIDAEANVYARVALWLYLLTGLRKSELLGARWEDVKLDRGMLRLPTTKAGRPHEVPLSAPALALLKSLPRLDGNPYLLPSPRIPEKPLEDLRSAWNRVRTSAGVADVRLHDLRRTVGSWLAQSGNSLHLIGRVLNHSNTSTTAIYARFAQDTVRDALEAHATRLMGAAGKLASAAVVDLDVARKAKG